MKVSNELATLQSGLAGTASFSHLSIFFFLFFSFFGTNRTEFNCKNVEKKHQENQRTHGKRDRTGTSAFSINPPSH
jgi:hypothetical protein